ncbi:hypothetical protein AB0F88_16335 [Streptosporangium sp. NPDC023963]
MIIVGEFSKDRADARPVWPMGDPLEIHRGFDGWVFADSGVTAP